MKNETIFSSRQLIFKELFVGTLIYAVVLGFFNDYSSIVEATSFSVIFLTSILLEVLTFFAFLLKNKIIGILKSYKDRKSRILMFFCVWLVMFFSKFVFIWAVDFTFGNSININGFFGILLVVLSVTIIHKLSDLAFIKLGDKKLA
jgi:EamA domain-containing membrane protein RarD